MVNTRSTIRDFIHLCTKYEVKQLRSCPGKLIGGHLLREKSRDPKSKGLGISIPYIFSPAPRKPRFKRELQQVEEIDTQCAELLSFLNVAKLLTIFLVVFALAWLASLVPKKAIISLFRPESQITSSPISPDLLPTPVRTFWGQPLRAIPAKPHVSVPGKQIQTLEFLAALTDFKTDPYTVSTTNFASSDAGTYIVYPDTQSFHPKPLSYPAGYSRSMEASHALKDSLAPGNCWAFSSQIGRLSFRMQSHITPTKLTIYHPGSDDTIRPSSISLLAHVPSDEFKKGTWEVVTMGDLHWQTSPDDASVFAEFNIPGSTLEASHYRLLAYLGQDANSEFGCIYKIDIQGRLLADKDFYPRYL